MSNQAKLIGQRWAKLSPEELAHYKELANEDMKRYKRQMEAFLIKSQEDSAREKELHGVGGENGTIDASNGHITDTGATANGLVGPDDQSFLTLANNPQLQLMQQQHQAQMQQQQAQQIQQQLQQLQFLQNQQLLQQQQRQQQQTQASSVETDGNAECVGNEEGPSTKKVKHEHNNDPSGLGMGLAIGQFNNFANQTLNMQSLGGLGSGFGSMGSAFGGLQNSMNGAANGNLNEVMANGSLGGNGSNANDDQQQQNENSNAKAAMNAAAAMYAAAGYPMFGMGA